MFLGEMRLSRARLWHMDGLFAARMWTNESHVSVILLSAAKREHLDDCVRGRRLLTRIACETSMLFSGECADSLREIACEKKKER